MNKTQTQVTVIAVRHAESQHNVLGVINGDPKKKFRLTQKGERQAEALAKKLKKKDVSEIIVSEMFRTQETARPLAKYKNVKIHIDKRLNDVKTGKLEGIQVSEFRKLTNNINKSVRGSESSNHLQKRLASFLKYLKVNYVGSVVVIISSEIVLHALIQMVHGKKPNEDQGKHFKNALVYEFRME